MGPYWKSFRNSWTWGELNGRFKLLTQAPEQRSFKCVHCVTDFPVMLLVVFQHMTRLVQRRVRTHLCVSRHQPYIFMFSLMLKDNHLRRYVFLRANPLLSLILMALLIIWMFSNLHLIPLSMLLYLWPIFSLLLTEHGENIGFYLKESIILGSE